MHGDHTNASVSTRGQYPTRLTTHALKGESATAGGTTTLTAALWGAGAEGGTTVTTLNRDEGTLDET